MYSQRYPKFVQLIICTSSALQDNNYVTTCVLGQQTKKVERSEEVRVLRGGAKKNTSSIARRNFESHDLVSKNDNERCVRMRLFIEVDNVPSLMRHENTFYRTKVHVSPMNEF